MTGGVHAAAGRCQPRSAIVATAVVVSRLVVWSTMPLPVVRSSSTSSCRSDDADCTAASETSARTRLIWNLKGATIQHQHNTIFFRQFLTPFILVAIAIRRLIAAAATISPTSAAIAAATSARIVIRPSTFLILKWRLHGFSRRERCITRNLWWFRLPFAATRPVDSVLIGVLTIRSSLSR